MGKKSGCRLFLMFVLILAGVLNLLLAENRKCNIKNFSYIKKQACAAVRMEGLPGLKEALLADRQAEAVPGLHAKAVCLMDLDTGRVLYGKNEEMELANASTTKIMTLLVLLKYGNLEDVVTISSYASRQPKVHLGVAAGEQFLFRDLCYSLMLESHNDSAYALAEHVGSRLLGGRVTKETTKEESQGYVRRFMEEVNKEAGAMGLGKTHFVTPNGLDGVDEEGEHHSTAADLCRMLCVAAGNENFCKITQTPSHSFSNCSGSHSCTVYNHNQLLSQMEGCITGKTGFTSKAGYCYAGAVQMGEKRFAGAVLACGWPPNKGYKWEDMRKLFAYGDKNYKLCTVGTEEDLKFTVPVKDGQKEFAGLVSHTGTLRLLLAENEKVKIRRCIPKKLTAPLMKGVAAGSISYKLGEMTLCEYPVLVSGEIPRKNFKFYFGKYMDGFFLKEMP